jgi:hypothetical protein
MPRKQDIDAEFIEKLQKSTMEVLCATYEVVSKFNKNKFTSVVNLRKMNFAEIEHFIAMQQEKICRLEKQKKDGCAAEKSDKADFIALRDVFFKSLERKTGWGRNELMALFNESVASLK